MNFTKIPCVMDEKERIELIIKRENLSAALFAAEIGIQSSTLSHIINGRNNPSLDVLKKILIRYPYISSDWLIMGQGSIDRSIKNSQAPSLFDFEDEIPLKSASSAENTTINSIDVSPTIQKNNVSTVDNPSVMPPEQMQIPVAPSEGVTKSIRKIIVYYTDNTFQEFQPN